MLLSTLDESMQEITACSFWYD